MSIESHNCHAIYHLKSTALCTRFDLADILVTLIQSSRKRGMSKRRGKRKHSLIKPRREILYAFSIWLRMARVNSCVVELPPMSRVRAVLFGC